MSGHHIFRCQKCPRQYHSLKQLQRHYREVHAQAMIACPFSGCSYSVTKAKAERMVRHKEICRCNPNRIPPPTSTPITTKKRKIEAKGRHEEDEGLREPSYPKEADLPEILLGYCAPEIPPSTAEQQALFPDPPRQVVVRESGGVTGEDLLALAAAMSGIKDGPSEEASSTCTTDVQEPEPLSAPVVVGGVDKRQPEDPDNGDGRDQGVQPAFIPLWDIRPMDRARRRNNSIYEGLELDPRLFFPGTPSTYSMGPEAEALREIHESARRLGERRLRFLPPDFTSYQREESAVLPDGTIYRIGSTLTRRWPPLRTTSCQTEEEITPCAISSKRDASTQTTCTSQASTETQCDIIQARIY